MKIVYLANTLILCGRYSYVAFVDLEEMWTNSANKFFDALAAGRPVAINYGSWQAEMLKDKGTGMVIDPKDPGLSAKILTKKIRDKEWLDSDGRVAKKLAYECFSRDKLAKQLEHVLLKVLE